jgi:chromosome segregation ATPase
MIQRYDLSNHWGMSEQDDGDYVLYTDHLAEVEQWKRIIVTHVDVIAEKNEMIAYNQGCYDDAIGEYRLEEQDLRRTIAKRDVRIGHLELANTELGEQSEYYRHELNRRTYELEHCNGQLQDVADGMCELRGEIAALNQTLGFERGLARDQITNLREELRLALLRGDSLDRVVDECGQRELRLQAEANRNMEELCRARAEKKDEYCQGCALPERMKELEAALTYCIEVDKESQVRIKEN